MNIKQKLFKGAAVLSLTQVTGQFCALGRNVIIARIISPTDFGIAAIFIMVVSFMEMISNISPDRLLVQALDGDANTFQRVAQLLQAIRGIVSAILLFVLAAPLSKIFSIPETLFAFYVLALIPLLNGFCHLDPRRLERHMRFWPYASVELTSQFVGLALAWPIGKWFGNYWAVLYLLVLKMVVMLVGSHLVAERKYSWSSDPHYMRRFFIFGWPLLINGLLMFAILQGDRFILGAAKKIFNGRYDMADVGIYSAAFMICMIPVLISGRVNTLLFFPILSKEQNSIYTFCNKARLFAQWTTCMAVGVGVVMILAGEKILPMIYGEKYSSTGTLVSWLGIFWTIRLMRIVPATIAMALNNTKILMYTNLIRLSTLTGVVFIVYNGMDIVWIAIIGTIGEIIAYFSSLIFINRILCIPFSIFFRPIVILTICILSAIITQTIFLEQINGIKSILLILVVSLFVPFITLIIFPELRKEIRPVLGNPPER